MMPDKCEKCGSANLVFEFCPVYMAGDPLPWVKNGTIICKACGFQKHHMEVVGEGGRRMNPNVEEKVAELISVMRQEADAGLPQLKLDVELGGMEVAISLSPATGAVHFQVRKWVGQTKKCGQIDFNVNDLPETGPAENYPRSTVLFQPVPEKHS